MFNRRRGEEDGATLVIVLVFMTVFGLILAGLLTESAVSLRFTSTVSDHESKVYAADAGVSAGIQQLHQNNEFCSNSGLPVPTVTVNERTVTIDCTVTSGAASGAAGFAVITTSLGTSPDPPSLDLKSGHLKQIGGPVFVNGRVDWGPGLEVKGGNFYHAEHSGSCGTPPDLGVGDDLSLLSPYGYYCAPLPVPDVPHTPPAPAPPPDAPSPSPISGDCQVFYPGTYTTPPTLTATDNYFASGVYYFNFTPASTEWKITDTRVFGGQASAFERGQEKLGGVTFSNGGTTSGSTTFTSATAGFTPADVGRRISGTNLQPSTTVASVASATSVNLSLPAMATGTGLSFMLIRPPACAQADPTGAPGYTPTGTGVNFVFGGDSTMNVFTQGEVELFGRTGDPSGTSNLSFVAVPSDGTWSGWTPSAPDITVLQIKDGDPQKLALHGVVYAPNQGVQLTATNDVIAQVLSGVVASTLEMQSSASAEGLAVSVKRGTPEPRKVLIKACTDPGPAPDGSCTNPGGERPVQSSAIVEISSDTARTVTVYSWRTRGPSDPL